MILTFLLVFSTLPGLAQDRYVMAPGPEMKVAGTSTLHDWEMVSSTATGTATVTLENGKIKKVQSASITMPAESLKSGRAAMDNNTYKALDSRKHPNITFTLREVQNIRYEGDLARMLVLGDLTVAGTTRRVEMDVTGRMDGQRIHFNGSTDVLLTDLNIEPPTAVLGTIRTGNAVTLSFTTSFQVESSNR